MMLEPRPEVQIDLIFSAISILQQQNLKNGQNMFS